MQCFLRFISSLLLYKTKIIMAPKYTAEEIEARDAARLNQLGYKQVHIAVIL